jgi:hypothetical protein
MGLLARRRNLQRLYIERVQGDTPCDELKASGKRAEVGYTEDWEGRSRLLQRWGALLPLGLNCHPPAQATRLRTLELACESSS